MRLLFEANEVLKDMKRLRGRMIEQTEKNAKYRGKNLKLSYRKGPRRYYQLLRGGMKPKYLGGENNVHVRGIKTLRYADAALEVIDKDINLLEQLIENYVSPEYNVINGKLRKTYQGILPGAAGNGNEAAMPAEAILWKERKEAEKKKVPPFKPEQRTNRALDGTMVRSKSEMHIANLLFFAGIPYVYEMPMTIRGKTIFPDFTILSLIDLKTEIIIEHQGMIYEDNYARKFIRSLRLYLHTNLIPNRDLFFTFDNARETIDLRQIESIIVKFVKPSFDLSKLPFSNG